MTSTQEVENAALKEQKIKYVMETYDIVDRNEANSLLKILNINKILLVIVIVFMIILDAVMATSIGNKNMKYEDAKKNLNAKQKILKEKKAAKEAADKAVATTSSSPPPATP